MHKKATLPEPLRGVVRKFRSALQIGGEREKVVHILRVIPSSASSPLRHHVSRSVSPLTLGASCAAPGAARADGEFSGSSVGDARIQRGNSTKPRCTLKKSSPQGAESATSAQCSRAVRGRGLRNSIDVIDLLGELASASGLLGYVKGSLSGAPLRAVSQLDLINGPEQLQSPRGCLVHVHAEAVEVQSQSCGCPVSLRKKRTHQ